MARKLKDFDTELANLKKQEKKLREARVTQFGELVCATGADALKGEALVGLLLDGLARAQKNPKLEEEWAAQGRAHFQVGRRTRSKDAAGGDTSGGAADKPADAGSPPSDAP